MRKSRLRVLSKVLELLFRKIQDHNKEALILAIKESRKRLIALISIKQKLDVWI